MGLDRLFREEQPHADLAIDETVGDQLENLDLACGRLLLQLLERARERNNLTATVRAASLGDRIEAATVVHVSGQDLFALGCVHGRRIGLGPWSL